MEPVDKRITAAQLMALRAEKNAGQLIAALLGVNRMHGTLATRTIEEIESFIENGDAVLAAQLIHATMVRRSRTPRPAKRSRQSSGLVDR